MDLATAALAAALAASPATPPVASAPSLPAAGPRIEVSRLRAGPAARDSVVEYSKLYYQRLTIHRWGSYAMLPLFAAQYIVGSKLYKDGATGGLQDTHAMLAGGIAGLFAINTATGLWNLYDSRRDPTDRGRRYTHATLMFLADAGFVATGLLADENEGGGTGGGASTHRAVAIGSMAVSTVGWLIMTDLFRK